jgi:hypothetical protein
MVTPEKQLRLLFLYQFQGGVNLNRWLMKDIRFAREHAARGLLF